MSEVVFSGDLEPTIAADLMQKLDELCYPRSIAVLGASEHFTKWGTMLAANLLYGGFEGPVYLINPKTKIILDRPAFPVLRDCPRPIDLAFITLPVGKVLAAVEECAAVGVKNLVIITSGFSETGAVGAAIERDIVAKARAANMRILGPNTMGMISTRQKLYMTGSVAIPPAGGISMISQSGNLGTQVMCWSEEQGVGINKFFGSGNEGDINCTDLLAYLGQDETTDAVLAYIEGVKDGRKFLRVAREVSLKKPIILLKSGRSNDGAKAAASHTGALAGSYGIWEGAMRQAGVILVTQPMDMVDGAAGLENLPLPKGNRVCIITIGGGWGVVTTDLCREYALTVPPAPDNIIKDLDKLLPPFWSRRNPIDLVGQVNPSIYMTAMELAMASDAFDAVITLGLIGSSAFAFEIANVANHVAPISVNAEILARFAGFRDLMESTLRSDIADLTERYKKPILNVSLDKCHSKVILTGGNGKKIVAFNTPEKAVRVLAGMTWYEWWRKQRV